MKKNQSKKKRYIVTYTDPKISLSESSGILGISTNEVMEGVSVMATDRDFSEEESTKTIAQKIK
jgi:hypothetical protein